eukprot:CAMPEP_0205860606 /NCGR_PEP_ID=MMETSP1083-20121108/5322_1 /ASSEMBLY_ACC=CAM_ASM_000430 /TAXON_ID=97485 /ORGANISM="Prymnesium parvum, Strain Texoma1" /LENGTH=65 /DNA_ID=CAMNT_0053222247 /DNA_START=392 /DNA_END=589 /DNA_ORIENTATION=+
MAGRLELRSKFISMNRGRHSAPVDASSEVAAPRRVSFAKCHGMRTAPNVEAASIALLSSIFAMYN